MGRGVSSRSSCVDTTRGAPLRGALLGTTAFGSDGKGNPRAQSGGREPPTIIGLHTSGIVDEQGRAYGCSQGTVLAPQGTVNSGIRMTSEIIADLRDPERLVAGERRLMRVL